jgi:hypothetical protein
MSGGNHMTAGGGHMISQPPGGQAPPSSQTQGIPLRRYVQQSEDPESQYDLQEMLKIWDRNMRSEGTLV